MRENRCPDGGFYLPFRHPSFSREEISALMRKPFGECVAEILNLLFHTKLTGWDIDFCVGSRCLQLENLPHRIVAAEPWHTQGLRFYRVVRALSSKLSGDLHTTTDWMSIGIRIAVLFGLFGELNKSGIETADLAVLAGDFSMPVSAWYARKWGLPIGRIICCCNENHALWELFYQGQMRTDSVSLSTVVPEADVSLPEDLERLIYECGGIAENAKYLDACRQGRAYSPADSCLEKLREGMYVSVVSSRRIESAIPGVYRSHVYLMAPATALTYSGLLDFRAKTGETGNAVIWSEDSPAVHPATTARILGIPEEQIEKMI